MSYNYKTHWLKSYFEGGNLRGDWAKEIKKMLIKGSVLDIGCGIGRFVPVFEGREYLGIDISPESIRRAKGLHPKKKFKVADIVYWKPQKKYDNIFTWVCLQHIQPKFIERAFKNILKIGKNIIMCEQTLGDVGLEQKGQYLFTHPYKEHFKILKEVKILDKTYLMRAK